MYRSHTIELLLADESRLSAVSRVEDQELSAKGPGISISSLQEDSERIYEDSSFFIFKRNAIEKH